MERKYNSKTGQAIFESPELTEAKKDALLKVRNALDLNLLELTESGNYTGLAAVAFENASFTRFIAAILASDNTDDLDKLLDYVVGKRANEIKEKFAEDKTDEVNRLLDAIAPMENTNERSRHILGILNEDMYSFIVQDEGKNFLGRKCKLSYLTDAGSEFLATDGATQEGLRSRHTSVGAFIPAGAGGIVNSLIDRTHHTAAFSPSGVMRLVAEEEKNGGQLPEATRIELSKPHMACS